MNDVGPLLSQLEGSKLPSHLQHLSIRLSRQFALVLTSATSPNHQLEHWTRLRSRLKEIEEELREAATATTLHDTPPPTRPLTEQSHTTTAQSYLDLAERTKSVREQLVKDIQLQSTTTRPSNTPSRDLSSSPEPRPRKARPPPSAVSPSSAAQSALDAILQSSNTTTSSPPAPATAQTKADSLSSAFTLHLLATSPSSLLSPNTSLSALLRSQLSQDPTTTTTSTPPTPPPTLQDRVTTSLRTAYFAQSTEELQTGLAGLDSASSSRVWKQLSKDLWQAVRGLIPARLGGGSVKRKVEEALMGSEEGAFEMTKAREVLRGVVELLGKLCAPARDGEVWDLVSSLSLSGSGSAEASALVEGVRRTLALAEGMQDDLSGFRKNLAGATMGDEELEEVVRREAGERERRAVREVLGEEGSVEGGTREWVENKLGERGVGWEDAGRRKQLVREAMWEALFEDQAVAIPSFDSPPTTTSSTPPSNTLPPTFYVPSPRLFALQNTLQALVILACLQHLCPPPPPPAPSSSPSVPNLQQRLWTLLSSTSAPETRPEEYTHLAHISEDILSAWTIHRGSSSESDLPPPKEAERTRISSSVERILRYEDPVFRLMKGRLREGIKGAEWVQAQGAEVEPLPSSMRSGRLAAAAAEGMRGRDIVSKERAVAVRVPGIKGFEADLVREKIEEAAREGLSVLKWVGEVWGREVGFVVE